MELECCACGRSLVLGGDVFELRECVVGPRGVVPLAEPLIFCSDDCLQEHVGDGGSAGTATSDDDSRGTRLSRRTP